MKKIRLLLFISIIFCLPACSDKEDEIEVYTVSFHTDGGTPTPSGQRVKAGETAKAPAESPTKAGYIFKFWQLEGTTSAYNFQTPVNRDISLYAQWQEESQAAYWQVSWELNGGAWSSEDNHATKVLKGGTLAEPVAPVKNKNTFEGWYKEAALTNQVNFPYDVSHITADFKLYAKWNAEGEEPQTSVAMLASGRYSSFILKKDGTLHAVGLNNYGQLGTGDNKDVNRRVQVAVDVAAVYTSGNSTFIIKKDGSLWATGENANGTLGLGITDEKTSFTSVPITHVQSLAVGAYFALLLKEDGSLWSSGFNAYGQLGVADTKQRETFTATNLPADVIAISAGYEHSLALKKDGTVWGAGYGYMGALGEKATNAEHPSFVEIFADAKAIAAGHYHSLLLKNDGTVYASGINDNGDLGVGHTNETTSFTQTVETSGSPLTNVVSIVAGYRNSFALKADGTLWASGMNNYGQLGIEDEKNRSSFTQVASGVKSISAGRFHCIVVQDDEIINTFGTVNPLNALNGSGTILIKVNDTGYYQYITHGYLKDRNNTQLTDIGKIVTGGSGERISVKPGIYSLELHISNSSVSHVLDKLAVRDNETVTITYEYVSAGMGTYRWSIKHSK